MSTEISLQRRIRDVVEEYLQKDAAIEAAATAFEKAGKDLMSAATVGGTYGQENIDTGYADVQRLRRNLLRSGWLNVWEGMGINQVATASDRKLFEQSLPSPPPLTLENVAASLGKYYENPRAHILRGLAEVFCTLDPAYKSHDKVRIGVKGLPKRVILGNVAGYGWGRDRFSDVLNALALYRNLPRLNYGQVGQILDDGDAFKDALGVRLVRHKNGNGHLFFEPDTLRDINLALAEYYGEVLPDCSEARPDQPQTSTAVSKDLQYYPTPTKVVERVLDGLGNLRDETVLEPSCGCGRFLDALREKGALCYGIEVDAGRAAIAKAKGHSVLAANFLETLPNPTFDMVVMNPPFYGKHYAKHIEHALKWLKPGGSLTAILPVTARYDHGLVDGHWQDLPFGSFAESGTNVNTTVLTIRKGSL